ncbi:MAG TPA: 4Fe-4S ferredoxin, partial [Candidatus Hydrogenedentes bacterium]|nr:4Fe-4S ferredoxin [Candidatus Hydrogenedentota bacterium]
MPKSSNKTSVVGQVVLLSVLIVALSFFSVVLWDAKPEEIPEARDWVLNEQMRIAEFAEANNVTEQILKEALHLTSKEELSKTIGSLGFSLAEIIARVEKAFALQAEHESKNWIKIRVKFVLWTTILVFVFVLLRHNRVTSRMRKSLYAFSIVLFGVIFGSDPSPMGTVKDAIALYGAKGAIFPPRMVALAIFLLMVVLANKFICSWGCQVGTLQD